jgi:hypothetical protein
MVTASLINRLSQAVDEVERRLQQKPLKVVSVRCGLHEDRDVARARHYARRPQDRGANIVIFKFCDDEEMADGSQDCHPPTEPMSVS